MGGPTTNKEVRGRIACLIARREYRNSLHIVRQTTHWMQLITTDSYQTNRRLEMSLMSCTDRQTDGHLHIHADIQSILCASVTAVYDRVFRLVGGRYYSVSVGSGTIALTDTLNWSLESVRYGHIHITDTDAYNESRQNPGPWMPQKC